MRFKKREGLILVLIGIQMLLKVELQSSRTVKPDLFEFYSEDVMTLN